MECTSIRLKELIDETVILLKNSKRVGDAIHVENDIQEDVEAWVDPMAIRQVLWNLATNAIEAMPKGGTLSFQVARKESLTTSETHSRKGMTRITVTDTGGGVDLEIRKKLFIPFYTTKKGGSGLGLSMVHQIVQQHGGWVDLVNPPDKGAVFHLYLPESAVLVMS